MEKFISEADILTSIKSYRKNLSYDDLFDIEIETNIMKLSDKAKERFNKNDRYSTYLSKRYNRHKPKTNNL